MKNLVKICIWGMILSPLISLLAACSEEDDCTLATRPMLYCNLYTIDEITEQVKKDTLDWLTITAIGTDSVILNKQEKVKDLILPLNYSVDTTKIVLHYDQEDRQTDTLLIQYTNTPYFLSMDCGYQMKQSIHSIRYTRYVLDSIHISNPEAGIYGNENIQMFY